MANIRQYIGARYVFKIYENSADSSSADWESGVTYEPLTIVTYLNSTYASKKDVPGSVGNPASNPAYWVVTGAYNGQIATLQQQIDTINNTTIPSIDAAIQALTNNVGDLDDLDTSDKTSIVAAINSLSNGISKRRFILLDSYGGYPDDTLSVKLAEYLDVNYDAQSPVTTGDKDIRFTGGIGFTNVNGQGTFTTFLTSIANEITDPEEIDELIVLGGANDYGGAGNAISTGISDFVTYANTLMPNAKIKIGCLSASRSTRSGIENHQITISAYRLCFNYGAEYLNNVEYIMHRISMTADNLHPATSACPLIARKVADAVLYGSCDVNYFGGDNLTAYTPSGSFDTLTLSAGVFNFNLNNGSISINTYINGTLTRSGGDTVNLQNYNTKIAELSDAAKIIVGRAQAVRPLVASMPVETFALLNGAIVDHRISYLYIDEDGDLEIALTYGSTGGLTCDTIRFVTTDGNGTWSSATC